jgi:undecaprenyl-diphosphatase
VDAFLLGLIEGLTEFLPVSSTGHLILLGTWLGHSDEASKTLDIVIQIGAVLAVVVYYRERLWKLIKGISQRDPEHVRLAMAVGIAFLPSAIVGLLLHKTIKQHLFGPRPVGAALIVGGIVMVLIETFRAKQEKPRKEKVEEDLKHVTLRQALMIGLAQCFSLWPGASRSMTTIVGGQMAGLGTSTAADFSFLLAIPTLGAATVYDLLKNGRTLLDSPTGPTSLVIGIVVSFVVALAVIATFLRYLKRFGLAPFGVYRIVLGAVVLLVL